MEVLKFVLLLLGFVFVQVVGALGNPLSRQEEEGETWRTWDNWQEYPQEGALNARLADLIKRSKAHQFHGLMGRSTGALYDPATVGRKRNKGAMFVGLMGRRSLPGDVDEQWNADFY